MFIEMTSPNTTGMQCCEANFIDCIIWRLEQADAAKAEGFEVEFTLYARLEDSLNYPMNQVRQGYDLEAEEELDDRYYYDDGECGSIYCIHCREVLVTIDGFTGCINRDCDKFDRGLYQVWL